jgi:uncharacterized membrane protein YcaP (DUF421 family)
MYLLFQDIDWKSLLLGDETWSFLLETAFRTIIMFTVILMSLRLVGKRGVKQLSVFELGLIIGLGSAAGDPMFYKDVGLLQGLMVFIMVIGLYRLITFLINKSDRFEEFVEGEPVCIVKEGCFDVAHFKKEPIARDEFFSQLRVNSISHLGQVKQAILETNGEVSIYYYSNEEVKYGLPIVPGRHEKKFTSIDKEDHYSCTHCGYTSVLSTAQKTECIKCRNKEWVIATNERRIT